METKKIVEELSLLIENKITEKDINRIDNLDIVISNFIDMFKNGTEFKSDEMLNELVTYIKIVNDSTRIHL